MKLKVKWILFDFGGCLDSDGEHSRTLFFNQFEKSHLVKAPQDLSRFNEAYTATDRQIIEHSLITDADLFSMNATMCSLIAKKLELDLPKSSIEVARAITNTQAFYLQRNKHILGQLNKEHKLGIVSNFSGNLERILREFSLYSYFEFVLDSYHVGHSKPDPEFFKLALDKCKADASEVCFIGDNPERDIIPASLLGMKTILISQNPREGLADFTLTSLEEVVELTQTR